MVKKILMAMFLSTAVASAPVAAWAHYTGYPHHHHHHDYHHHDHHHHRYHF